MEDKKMILIIKCGDLLKEYNSRVATLYELKDYESYTFIEQDAVNFNIIRINKIIFDMFIEVCRFFEIEDLALLLENKCISQEEYNIFNDMMNINPIIEDVEISRLQNYVVKYNVLAKAVIQILNEVSKLSEESNNA